MFYASKTWHAGTNCAFLHDDKNLYKGPAPKAAAKAKGDSKGKTPRKPTVAAGAAVVLSQVTSADGECLSERIKDVVKTHLRHAPTKGMFGAVGAVARLALTTAAMTMGKHIPCFGVTTSALTAASIPKTSSFDFEWISDTGAGRNLSNLKHLPPQVQEFIGQSKSPVSFVTGGGTKDGIK